MAHTQLAKAAIALTSAAIIAVGGMFLGSVKSYADSVNNDWQTGLSIAPVPLTYADKDKTLVGHGSYIVNAQADCNGCHVSDPTMEYLPTNNPYFLPGFNYPWKINTATYLAGGNDFGPVGGGIVGGMPGPGPDIITRNLTPDHTGLPEGGHSLSDFMTIIRTGYDFDHLHPNCSLTVTNNCYFAVTGNEVDGNLLQIMPWPTFSHMTDYDLEAIWMYLKSIPCNANSSSPYSWVRNVC